MNTMYAVLTKLLRTKVSLEKQAITELLVEK